MEQKTSNIFDPRLHAKNEFFFQKVEQQQIKDGYEGEADRMFYQLLVQATSQLLFWRRYNRVIVPILLTS